MDRPGGVVKLNDTQTGEELHALTGHAGGDIGLAFSPNGTTLVSASRGETVRLWDTRTGEVIDDLTEFGDDVTCVAFSPRLGTLTLATASGRSLTVWDLEQNETIMEPIQPLAYSAPIRHMAFSPDGTAVAVGGRGMRGEDDLKVIATDSGRVICEFGGERKNVGELSGIAWKPDSKMVVTAGWSGQVSLWDIDSGQLHFSLPTFRTSVWCVAYSADGQTIGVGWWDKITLFSTGLDRGARPGAGGS